MESTSKKVTLSSSDGRTFEVEEAVAFQSQTIKHLYETGYTGDFIPVPNVTGDILSMVLRYCEKHVDSDTAAGKESFYDNKLKRWDALFVKVDQSTLFDLILAADFMNINSLMDLTCKTVANMMKGKTTEEIRGTFNIKNDYTPEAEEMLRKECRYHQRVDWATTEVWKSWNTAPFS
ncbi:hypothetical protein Godav_029327 [Gossypium davidsonii]|uniref:SKP1-like protein n=1 Tax=Gossypium davidsonii TaxID=34287 RepID=A0A7J8TIW8_GOSDV|nr:hypothetical protein [Gossypium davidsonii]